MPQLPNPELEIAPDFTSDHYLPLRQELINAIPDSTHESIAQRLQDSWALEHGARLDAFNAQRQLAQEEREQAQRDETERLRQVALQSEQDKLSELDKIHERFGKASEDLMVDDYLVPRPSNYALEKLRKYEYVELYYFTPEGCRETALYANDTSDNTYAIAEDGDRLTLKTAASTASRHVIKDAALTWEQVELARPIFFQHISTLQWPAQYIEWNMHFFLRLGSHPYRGRVPFGPRALVHYQARVRRQWHDALAQKRGFNLSIINEALLRQIFDELQQDEKTLVIQSVRFSPSPVTPTPLTVPTILFNHAPLTLRFTHYAPPATCYMPLPTLRPSHSPPLPSRTLRAACYMPPG
ncbi:hypothetical protein EW146_g9698 [Bondarzewia mesenterica]|uniref:Uncharacterized protein n=1 Tax=Bondarzewia mesenterica TaxID=1095465 RepID=A0A4S4L4B6_9AGAM|nr:hypothetical protein EW146_g9698 [Bondarzewia mesenterica]